MDNKQRRIAKLGRLLAKSLRLTEVKVRIDWHRWLRLIQRKRHLLTRAPSRRRKPLPNEYFANATVASFRLEGIQIDQHNVTSALRVARRIKRSDPDRASASAATSPFFTESNPRSSAVIP